MVVGERWLCEMMAKEACNQNKGKDRNGKATIKEE